MRRLVLSIISAALIVGWSQTAGAQVPIIPNDPLGPNGRLYFDVYRQMAAERQLLDTQQQVYQQGQAIRQGYIVRSEPTEGSDALNTINPRYRGRGRPAPTRGGPNAFERGTGGYFLNYGGYYRMPAPRRAVAAAAASAAPAAPSFGSYAQSYANPSTAARAPISLNLNPLPPP